MKKIQWWLRGVGSFYLLLALTSLWVLFINPQLFGEMFPFAADALSIRAFSDAWLIFILEMAGLGAMMLYGSQNPARNGILVLTVAVLELVRGWPVANYLPFMVVHIGIALTGLWTLRQEKAAKSDDNTNLNV